MMHKMHSLNTVKKCLDGSVPPYLLNYFKLNELRTLYKTRNITDITLSKARLEVAKRAFYYIGAVQYNNLPSYIKEIQTLDGFSQEVAEYFKSV